MNATSNRLSFKQTLYVIIWQCEIEMFFKEKEILMFMNILAFKTWWKAITFSSSCIHLAINLTYTYWVSIMFQTLSFMSWDRELSTAQKKHSLYSIAVQGCFINRNLVWINRNISPLGRLNCIWKFVFPEFYKMFSSFLRVYGTFPFR